MKVLIVDGHPTARDRLNRLCDRCDDVQVVGEAGSGEAAIDAVGTLNPDLLLVDVELPDMSGFELLQPVGTQPGAFGIMVSNSDQFATRTFAVGAVDYLVMPVPVERFDLAIERARHRLTPPEGEHSRLSAHSTDIRPAPRPQFLVGERQRRLYPLDPKLIDYIEADGNYVTLRVGKVEYLRRDSIKCLSTELEPLGFIRIERSLLVNAAAVAYAEVAGHGTYALTLKSGVCLHSSAAYRASILRTIPLPALSKRYSDPAL